MNTKGGNYLIPIGVSFFAVAAFLLVLSYALKSQQPGPLIGTGNKNHTVKNQNEGVDASANTNVNTNTNAGANTNSATNLNTNTSVNTNSASTGTSLVFDNTLSLKSSIYTWQGGVVKKVALANGAVSSQFSFPTSGKVQAVAYDDQTDNIAYITTEGDTDTLKFRHKDNDTFWRLDTITRAGTDEVQQAAHYTGVHFFTHDLVMGTAGFWEGCSDRIISVSSKQKLQDGWCGDTSVSPDGKLFVTSSAAGIATGNDLSTATSVSGPYKSVDWAKVGGDTNGFLNDRAELQVGFNVLGFTSNTVAVVEVLPMTNTGSYMATMDFANHAFHKLPNSLVVNPERSALVGNDIISVNEKQFIVYHMNTQKTTTYTLGPDLITGTESSVVILATTNDAVIMSVTSDYQDGTYYTHYLLTVDPATGHYRSIGQSSPVYIAGVATK